MGGELHTQCCIVGCGPAGAMLGLILARQGLDVVVLEKHHDFLRDFRGDDISPSTLEVLDELGLASAFLELAPRRVPVVEARTADGMLTLADLRLVHTRFPFIAIIPQWDFLEFLTRQAARHPGFHLLMGAAATGLVERDGVVGGVRYRSGEGLGEVRATLTVAADGRSSVLRERARLPLVSTGPPIDLLWFRLPRTAQDRDESAMSIHLVGGRAVGLVNRGDYWQIACMIPKGSATQVRAEGIEAFRDSLRAVLPGLAAHIPTLQDWDQVSLLSVQANRLRRWYRAGLLCIGDAAHAMSPIGGAGINFAIADAVVAANRLARPLADDRVSLRDLAAVQRERAWQVRLMQVLQARLTRGYLAALERGGDGGDALSGPGARLVNLPGFCRLRSRITALGFRRVHVAVGTSAPTSV